MGDNTGKSREEVQKQVEEKKQQSGKIIKIVIR